MNHSIQVYPLNVFIFYLKPGLELLLLCDQISDKQCYKINNYSDLKLLFEDLIKGISEHLSQHSQIGDVGVDMMTLLSCNLTGGSIYQDID